MSVMIKESLQLGSDPNICDSAQSKHSKTSNASLGSMPWQNISTSKEDLESRPTQRMEINMPPFVSNTLSNT